MRRPLVLLAAVLAVALVLTTGCGRGAKGSSDSEGTLKIGAVLSLSGTYSGLGVPEKNAIELELARINDAGGIDGRKVEVLIEDDASDPAKAQAAAAKLIEQDGVVALIGATGTGQTMAMRPDAERAGVPIVSMAGGSVITDDFSPLVFQTPWPNRLVVPFTAEYLKAKGVRRIALVSDSGGYGKDGRDVTLKALQQAGIEVVADEIFNPGDSDVSSQLTKVAAAEPQAVWLWSAGKEAAVVAKNWQTLGVKAAEGDWTVGAGKGVQLIGAPGNGRVEFIDGSGDAAEGFTFAGGKILLPESYGKDSEAYRVATDFTERYTERFGKAPDIFAGHAYDALHVVVQAAKRIDGEATPDAMRDAIEKTSGLVGIGGTFTYSADDHNGLTANDLVMYTIEGGKWVLAK